MPQDCYVSCDDPTGNLIEVLRSKPGEATLGLAGHLLSFKLVLKYCK